MSPSMALGLIALVVFLLAVRIGWVASVHFRRWRRVRAAPTVKISAALTGLVEVAGRAVCDQPILSPFSGQPCVECRWTISLPRRHKGHLHWDVTAHGVQVAPGFSIEDATGKLPLAKDAAHTLYLRNAEGVTTEKPTRSIAEVKVALAAQGLTDTQFVEGWCRFHEDILLVGDPLYALGEVRTFPGGGREIHAGEHGEVLIGNLSDGEMQRRLEKEFRPRMVLSVALGLPSLAILGWVFLSEEFYELRARFSDY